MAAKPRGGTANMESNMTEEIENAATRQMNGNERRALAKIVTSRIDLLARQLAQAEADIRPIIKQRIIDEQAAKIAPLKKRLDLLTKRARTLNDEGVQLYRDIEAAGLSVNSRWYGNRETTISVETCGLVEPVGINELVKEEIGRLLTEKGRAGIKLKEIEQSLKEELLLGEVTSADAQSFLDRIPTVSTFMNIGMSESQKFIAATIGSTD